MNQSQIAQHLSAAFPNLDQETLLLLADAAVSNTFPAGSIICRQGEIGESLFVLVDGIANVFVSGSVGVEIMVNTLEAPHYFGEMALLGDETERSATIQADTKCETLVLDRHIFLRLIEQHPAVLRGLALQLIEHLRNNDRAIIHELRDKNNALEVAYADLAAQEQMRREFITTLSHELRTPLTSVQGFLQLINKGIVKGDSIPVALDSITRNVEQLVSLTNNLLVLYEMQLTSPEYTDVVVADVLMSAMHKLQERRGFSTAAVSIEIEPRMPLIRGDVAGLTLAIHALIENGIKFSPEDTAVIVRVNQPEPNIVQIMVEDQGIGIPYDMHHKIFDPFFRLEKGHTNNQKLFPGVGIGLSIAKFIIERHGGTIGVESQVGQGSKFIVCLPAERHT